MKKNLIEEIGSGTKSSMIKKKIINHYIYHGNSTITELSKKIELSVPTVTKFVMGMCKSGYINEFGKLETNGGRHPNLYGLNPDSGYFVGVDVQPNMMEIGLVNFNGDIIATDSMKSFTLRNEIACLDYICNYIVNFIKNSPISMDRILNVNVSMPGRINPDTGENFTYFDFGDTHLSQAIEKKINIHCTIDNDTRSMAYGEYMKGCVENEKDIIFINLSWGLAIGIIIDGKLYWGKTGFAGEFGHIPAYDNEILCMCGKKGCLQTEISGLALKRQLVDSIKNGAISILSSKISNNEDITLDDIIDATNREDTLCIEMVESIGEKLGRQIAMLINIFNPETVILGGSISQTKEFLLQPVQTAVMKFSMNIVNKDSTIKLSSLKEKAGVIGTCMLARSKMFEC